MTEEQIKDTFRYFIRKNFSREGNQMSNNDLDELGEEFKNYLNKNLNQDQKERILPKSPMDVIMQSESPLTQNGFHPAYVYHFTEFMKTIW